MLEAQPHRVEARLARGYALAFQGRFEKAQLDFRQALDDDADNLGALSGLGYVLAWSGSYAESEEKFRRVLALAPGQPDAVKGLAWVALWRGDAPEAARQFEAMARQSPESAEAQVGLGQSLLGAGRRGDAQAAFSRALQIDPGRADARVGLESAQARGPLLDVTVLGGFTDLGDSSRAGLRFAEIGVTPTESTRFWFQFDDSLSLDAPGLAQQGLRVPSSYLGGLLRWGDRYITKLEGGWRKLEAGGVEPLVRAEQVAAVGGVALKLGGWLGPRPDDRLEAGAHFAVAVPLGDRLQLEPAIFYGTSGLAGEHELRGLLGATYRLTGAVELGAGLAAGHAFSPTPAFEGTLLNGYAGASVRLASSLRAHLLFKHDQPQIGPSTNAYVVGFSAAFGGRP